MIDVRQAGSISPPILGLFYDKLDDKADIRRPLFLTVAGSYLSAALVFWLAMRSLRHPAATSTAGMQLEMGPSGCVKVLALLCRSALLL